MTTLHDYKVAKSCEVAQLLVSEGVNHGKFCKLNDHKGICFPSVTSGHNCSNLMEKMTHKLKKKRERDLQ